MYHSDDNSQVVSDVTKDRFLLLKCFSFRWLNFIEKGLLPLFSVVVGISVVSPGACLPCTSPVLSVTGRFLLLEA